MASSSFSPVQPTQLQQLQLDLQRLNQRFEKNDPKRILSWCLTNLPTNLVQVSNFSLEHLVITDLLYRQLTTTTPATVLFVDTLHHCPETVTLVKRAQQYYPLDLVTVKPVKAKTKTAFTKRYGAQLWQKDIAKYRQLTQNQPLEQALQERQPQVLITGTRRSTADPEQQQSIFTWNQTLNCIQVNPIAYWTRTESWAYTYEYDMFYNPLYDEGYVDIDDASLTAKPQPIT